MLKKEAQSSSNNIASALTSTHRNTKKSTNTYNHLNLAPKLNAENFQNLCKAKNVQAEQPVSSDSQIFENKYEELAQNLKELHQEFYHTCLTENLRSKLSSIYEKVEEDPQDIIKSIKSLLGLVGNTLREQEKIDLKNNQGNLIEDYELMLQKAEGDLKRYIRTEQQLNHVITTLQAKLEEYDKDKENFLYNAKNLFKDAKSDNAKLIDLIRQKDAEIGNSNKIIKQKDESIKSYQERLLSIPILEHKLNGLRESHEKEKEQIKRYYKQEFANLTKEVQHIHHVLSVNLGLDEKLKILESELYTYKDFNIKKIQMLEEKIDRMDYFNEKLEIETQGFQPPKMEDYGRLQTKSSIGTPKASDQIMRVRPTTATSNKTRMIGNIRFPSYDEKISTMKQKLNKKKNNLVNELNILSVARIHDLNKESARGDKEDWNLKNPKVFDGYFAYLQGTLEKINQVHEKEKQFLKTASPVDHSKFEQHSVQGSSMRIDEDHPYGHHRRPGSRSSVNIKISSFQPKSYTASKMMI